MGKAKAIAHAPLTGHSVVRLLISSYFIALALDIIPGSDLVALADPFMPAAAASILTSSIVVALALGILLGVQRRAAALLLAIVVFWASYLTMLDNPVADDIAAFWRDLALIGALILTYADTAHADKNEVVAVFQHLPRAQVMKRHAAPKKTVETRKAPQAAPSPDGRRPRVVSDGRSLYREDLDLVRAS